MINKSFYKNKKILITGHTGFKGAWLCELLLSLGSDVYGYALKAQEKSLYNQCNLDNYVKSYYGDIRDYDSLSKFYNEVNPEIVIHMAAQAIVSKSYEDPKYTYETNILGTINILECLKNNNSCHSFINVTTDKVYQNINDKKLFNEDDILFGDDPYSNSKSCSELITKTYAEHFINTPISTLRSGNVIGGGDYSIDRIIPDCIRALKNNETLLIRNPDAIRPYQHVLEALRAYLMVIEKQYNDSNYSDSYNVGPDEKEIKTIDLINLFNKQLNRYAYNLKYEISETNHFLESKYLLLDNTKIKNKIGWLPNWNIDQALAEIADYYKHEIDNNDIHVYISNVISNYLK